MVEGYFMELSIGEGSNKKVTIDDGNFFLGSSIRGIISVITIAMVKPVWEFGICGIWGSAADVRPDT